MIMVSILEMDRKKQHRHAHALLRETLRPLNIEYSEETPVVKGEYGKPSLAEYPDVHYNLSHADGIAACIVSRRECGIDCESVRKMRPNVMKRAFSEAERRLVEKAPEEKRDFVFTRLWTLKEAYVKMRGIGIGFPLNEAEFDIKNGRIITNLKGCSFRQYIIKGKYIVSVCESD